MLDITYKTYRNENISEGGSLLIKNRLYTPKNGCIRNGILSGLIDIIILAFHGETPIACVVRDKYGTVKTINNITDNYHYINIWVKPAYRKNGIGSELINYLKRISRKRILGHATDDGHQFYPKAGIIDIPYKSISGAKRSYEIYNQTARSFSKPLAISNRSSNGLRLSKE